MGILAALLSTVFATAKDLVSKRLAAQLDSLVSTFASFAFALPYYLLLLAVLFLLGREQFDFSLAFLGLVFLRSVTDTFAEGMKMYALAHGDISLVATFLSLSPLFLLIASPLLTGDPLTEVGVVAVLLVVAGSLLVVYRPNHAEGPSQTKGILFALGASLFFSLNSCFDRLAVEQGTPVFAGFAMTLCSALFLAPLVLRRQQGRGELRAYAGEFALRGFLEIAFMVAKLYALTVLQAPYVVGIQRLTLVFSIVAGRVLFREPDFGRRLAAGVIILGGVLLIVWSQL
jgi:drug/metabolite transporter (DMT)-like permease